MRLRYVLFFISLMFKVAISPLFGFQLLLKWSPLSFRFAFFVMRFCFVDRIKISIYISVLNIFENLNLKLFLFFT